jgi:hypothetical protein
MGIACSTFYDRPAVSFDDTALVERMAAISDSFETYGHRRMRAARISEPAADRGSTHPAPCQNRRLILSTRRGAFHERD